MRKYMNVSHQFAQDAKKKFCSQREGACGTYKCVYVCMYTEILVYVFTFYEYIKCVYTSSPFAKKHSGGAYGIYASLHIHICMYTYIFVHTRI